MNPRPVWSSVNASPVEAELMVEVGCEAGCNQRGLFIHGTTYSASLSRFALRKRGQVISSLFLTSGVDSRLGVISCRRKGLPEMHVLRPKSRLFLMYIASPSLDVDTLAHKAMCG